MATENHIADDRKKVRLIDANTVYEMGHRTPFHIGIADLCDLKELLEDVPTVDAVEVVHGRWEKHEPDKAGNRKPKCSVCGEYHFAWWSDYTHCNYCPNCGAKMDGGADNG